MDAHQLPDLSAWRYIEVWTLEETAMLWAAIDPADYEGLRLANLKSKIPRAQYKKASMSLRAVTEAVCLGTLAFVDAYEDYSDGGYCNDGWRMVKFPDTPNANSIITHMTRISQSAFLKWAKNKNLPSYRQELAQSRFKTAAIEQSPVTTARPPAPQLLLPVPAFLDPSNPCSPEELRISAEVWEIVTSNGLHERGKAVKTVITEILNSRPEFAHLSKSAKERITTVTNWNKAGGPPNTPGG